MVLAMNQDQTVTSLSAAKAALDIRPAENRAPASFNSTFIGWSSPCEPRLCFCPAVAMLLDRTGSLRRRPLWRDRRFSRMFLRRGLPPTAADVPDSRLAAGQPGEGLDQRGARQAEGLQQRLRMAGFAEAV